MPYTVQKTDVFEAWLDALVDQQARRTIIARIIRAEAGLLGDVKGVGKKVSEMRVDVGPGYRLYYTQRGKEIILLLCGGDKDDQKRDIRAAQAIVKELDEAAQKVSKGKRK